MSRNLSGAGAGAGKKKMGGSSNPGDIDHLESALIRTALS